MGHPDFDSFFGERKSDDRKFGKMTPEHRHGTFHLSIISHLVLQLLFLLSGINSAMALVGDTEGGLGVDGSFRTIGALTHNYENQALFEKDTNDYLQSILRLTAAGRPFQRVSYEAHLVTAFTYTSARGPGGGSGLRASGGKTRYRAFDTSWDFIDNEENRTGGVWLDRFNVKVGFPQADLTIGRQAITFGKAFFWNPLDLYLPFDPAQFDRDYKAGVDALRLDIPLGLFSGVNLIYVLGRELDSDNQYPEDRTLDASWSGSSILLRGFTHVAGWDLTLQGGKVYGGWHMGGGLVGEIKSLQVRFEAAQFWADDGTLLPPPKRAPLLEDNLTAVVGLGRHWPSSLDIQVECLFNGGGESHDITLGLERAERGAVFHAGRILAGITVSYELTPLILGQLALLQSQTDGSTQIQPTLRWSTSDNSELLLGASINCGDRPTLDPVKGIVFESEFGSYPNYFFAEFKAYF
ncbi:MAG: hypothetical protein DRG82_06005 [Deltaproteobacteria bacterium]|nr:MAG: hypothetical protein DRG82_06005 [Deltaproteobacteria bacterium]